MEPANHLGLLDEATLERMSRPYRWLIRRVGDQGLTLTNAGYLPPTAVRESLEVLGHAWLAESGRKIYESRFPPLLNLRRSAQELGLIRKARGVLRVTARGGKLVDDPLGLLCFLVERLTAQTTQEVDRDATGVFAALLAFAERGGAPQPWSLVADILTDMGWHQEGQPLTWPVARALPERALRLATVTGTVEESGGFLDSAAFAPRDGGIELGRALATTPLKA
jgi:hypothetical protein